MTGQGCDRSLAVLTFVAACGTAVACDASVQDESRPTYDSVAASLTRLEPSLSSYFAQTDSMAVAMRRDSGTARADTSYWVWRDRLAATLAGTSGILMQDPRFRADSVRRALRSRGIWAFEAEGSPYFEVSNTYLRDRVGPYLTPPMREAVAFLATDQEKPPAGDGSILITWDEFFERLATTEDLLERHPDLAGVGRLRDRSRWYLQFALHGGPNSSVFDRRTRALDPEMRTRYEAYVAAHPASPAGKVMADYVRLLAAGGHRRSPAVDAFLRELTAPR